jgi:hypothetical protein
MLSKCKNMMSQGNSTSGRYKIYKRMKRAFLMTWRKSEMIETKGLRKPTVRYRGIRTYSNRELLKQKRS